MTDADKSPEKDEGLLVSVAESIGSTLGSLAAKASAAQKSFGKSTAAVVRKVAPAKRKTSGKKTSGRRVQKSRAKRVAKPAKGSRKRAASGKKKRSRGR